jgi:hypothetical protein
MQRYTTALESDPKPIMVLNISLTEVIDKLNKFVNTDKARKFLYIF